MGPSTSTPRSMPRGISEHTSTQKPVHGGRLMAALFVMAANRQQPKCPPPSVRRGSWSLHTMEERSAMSSEGPLHTATWPRLSRSLADAEAREAERCWRQREAGRGRKGGWVFTATVFIVLTGSRAPLPPLCKKDEEAVAPEPAVPGAVRSQTRQESRLWTSEPSGRPQCVDLVVIHVRSRTL